MAYCARYGKQPLPVLMALRYSDLMRFAKAIEKLIHAEANSTP